MISKATLIFFLSLISLSAFGKHRHTLHSRQQCHKPKRVLHYDARTGGTQARRRDPVVWKDLSSSHLNGVLSGGFLTDTSTWKKETRRDPASLVFNGQDEYVNAGESSVLRMTDSFSVEVWFKPTNWGGSPIEGGMLINREGEYELGVSGDGLPRGAIWYALSNDEPGWRAKNTGIIAQMDRWNHVAWTYDANIVDGNNLFMYYNGELRYAVRGRGPIDDTRAHVDEYQVWIGGRQHTAIKAFFEGEMSIVRVYKGALSHQQVYRHCRVQQHRFDIDCHETRQ